MSDNLLPVEQRHRDAAALADDGAINAARSLADRECGALQSEMRDARKAFLAEFLARFERDHMPPPSDPGEVRANALEEVVAYLDDYAGGHYMARSCAAAVRELISTPIASAEVGWRDISSAPKDGAEVLIAGGTFRDDESLGGPYLFKGISIAHWTGDDHGEDHPWEGNPSHSHDDYRRHAPLLWQPLPPLSTISQTGEVDR